MIIMNILMHCLLVSHGALLQQIDMYLEGSNVRKNCPDYCNCFSFAACVKFFKFSHITFLVLSAFMSLENKSKGKEENYAKLSTKQFYVGGKNCIL